MPTQRDMREAVRALLDDPETEVKKVGLGKLPRREAKRPGNLDVQIILEAAPSAVTRYQQVLVGRVAAA